MGAKCFASKIGEEENDENISTTNFTKKYPIGKGGFGRVRDNIYN